MLEYKLIYQQKGNCDYIILCNTLLYYFNIYRTTKEKKRKEKKKDIVGDIYIISLFFEKPKRNKNLI